MKILIISLRGPTNADRRGGSQDYILNISKPWVKAGHQVVILCGQEYVDGKLLPVEESIQDIHVLRVGTAKNRAVPLMKAAAKMARDTDVVIENIMGFPLFTPLYVRHPVKLVAIKHHFEGINFIHSQGWLKGKFGLFLEGVLQPLLYRNTAFVVVSEKTKRELYSKWPGPRGAVAIVPPGIDIPSHRNSAQRTSVPSIVYVGALDTGRKRVDHLIEAFKVVGTKVPGASLYIGGRGPDADALVTLATGQAVEFLGFLTDDQKSDLLAKAWVFASPSTSEGFGITWVEANSFGVPVVGYDLGLDTVDDTCSRMVPVGDVNALASALVEILTDRQRWSEMSEAAYRNARRFEWGCSSGQFMEFIKRQ